MTQPPVAKRPRWRWPAALALGVVAAAALVWWQLGPATGWTPRALNVVVVTADTLSADKLGCYGNPDIETPHLDRLAASGVLFENAVTTSPITLPAHASLFTGTYPIHHGVRDNGGYYLEPEHRTLAESLKEQGYATGAFVGAFVLDSRWGLDQGFDRYFDDFDLSRVDDATLGSISRPGEEVLEEAISWMDSTRDAPFFAWIHLFDPHQPYDPPEPFRTRYRDHPWGAYDGEVAYVDSLVGKLTEWLDSRNLMDSTVIVFVGDHGESLGEHGELTHGFFVYDATMHVPFILRAPYSGLAGRRVEARVRTIDVMPTVLELVGIDEAAGHHGASLVPLATGRLDDLDLVAYGETVFPERYGWSHLASLRTKKFHYIDAPTPELYDLERDPDEQTNVISSHARNASELRSKLREIEARYRAAASSAPAPATLDPETRDKLAALGYLGSPRGPSTMATDADPKDKVHLYELLREAATATREGRFDGALEAIDRVIAEDPHVPEAHNMAGNVHSQQGNHERALLAYKEALAEDPQHLGALFSLALTYEELGRIEEATVGLERVLELDPRASQASFVLAQMQIDREEFNEALSTLGAIEDPGSAGERALRRNLVAECYIGLDRLDDARAELDRALELKPDLPDAHYNLGVIFERRGNMERAMEAYGQELEVSPNSFRAHFGMAKLFGATGRADEMIDHLETTIEINPRFAVGHLYLANAYLERGNLERAIELAKRGIELGPSPELAPFGHFILADSYQRLGRHRDAAREMELAKKLQGS